MHEFSWVWKTNLPIVLIFGTIQNEPKQAEMKLWNQQPATSIRNQLFLNHVHKQADFTKPILNGRDIVYLGISKMVFTLEKLEKLI